MMYDSSEFMYLRDYIRQQSTIAKTSDLMRTGKRKGDFSCLTGS